MAEYLDKWAVVDKLIRLENNYNFFKKKWDKETLYRRICELEIELAKTAGLEIVRCGECVHRGTDSWCEYVDEDPEFFCSRGERKDDAENH